MADKPPRYLICGDNPKQRNDQFCSEHKILICQLCSTISHKRCPTANLDQVCKNISKTEVNALLAVSSFKTSLQSVLPSLCASKDTLEEQKKKMLKEAELIYRKMIVNADEMYQDMKFEIV